MFPSECEPLWIWKLSQSGELSHRIVKNLLQQMLNDLHMQQLFSLGYSEDTPSGASAKVAITRNKISDKRILQVIIQLSDKNKHFSFLKSKPKI